MDKKRGIQPKHERVRRLGKKAIFYGRVATALGVPAAQQRAGARRLVRSVRRARSFRPTRKQLIMVAGVLVVLVASMVGAVLYHNHQVVAAKAAAKAAYEHQQKIEAAAQQCYARKTAEKQQMLGKVTFDQLYDGDSCITGQ